MFLYVICQHFYYGKQNIFNICYYWFYILINITIGRCIISNKLKITAICDEYIAVIDSKPYASDMECFVPLMKKFRALYGHYPKYPVADAGYGSYNNYLYCEEHGMEKYMKFTMFEK